MEINGKIFLFVRMICKPDPVKHFVFGDHSSRPIVTNKF